jgi:hypothetical protein
MLIEYQIYAGFSRKFRNIAIVIAGKEKVKSL